MKIILETISAQVNSSFNLIYDPQLSDLFYWHFHPEYELVYIRGATGTRHVGNHISTYEDSDMVLIGGNIPHLNFDYGVKTDYRKVVVHIQRSFVEKQLKETPEFTSIARMMEKSRHGLAFYGDLKKRLGKQLFELEHKNSFERYLNLLQIFEELAHAADVELLHESPYTDFYSDREQARLRNIYAYIDQHYHQKIQLQELADLSHMTREAFCRYFKKITGSTFIAFLNQYRIAQSKRILMQGLPVGEACFRSGFESLSYFNRTFKKMTGENPSAFRKRYR